MFGSIRNTGSVKKPDLGHFWGTHSFCATLLELCMLSHHDPGK